MKDLDRMRADSAHLFSILTVLPTDYTDYGGTVVRWADPNLLSNDCSQCCKWARYIEDREGDMDLDWLVCTNPNGPRKGLLTWEHQAGAGCWEMDLDPEGAADE